MIEPGAIDVLLAHWGYLVVAVGTFLEGESVLLAGAALAHRGPLSLPLVILAAFFGSLAGDQVWFLVGRRYGRAFIATRPRLAARAVEVESWISRRGSVFVVDFRFLYGLRTVSPLVLGASGYPARRFLVLNAIGAALWSSSFGAIGFGMGAGLHAVLGRATTWIEALVVSTIVALGLLGLVRRRRARGRGSDPSPP